MREERVEGGDSKLASSSVSAGNFPIGLLQSANECLLFELAELVLGVQHGLGSCVRSLANRVDAVNRQDFPQG